jgi:hypothetical protein
VDFACPSKIDKIEGKRGEENVSLGTVSPSCTQGLVLARACVRACQGEEEVVN